MSLDFRGIQVHPSALCEQSSVVGESCQRAGVNDICPPGMAGRFLLLQYSPGVNRGGGADAVSSPDGRGNASDRIKFGAFPV